MVLVIVGNAVLNYVPVAYNGENFQTGNANGGRAGDGLPSEVKPVDMVKKRV